MSEPRMPSPEELRRIVAEVESWPTSALGRMIGELRPSVESGEASSGTQVAVRVLCDVLGQRKVLPMP